MAVCTDYLGRWSVLRGLTVGEASLYALSVTTMTTFFRFALEAWVARRSKVRWAAALAITCGLIISWIQRDFALRYGVGFDPAAAAAVVSPLPPCVPFLKRLTVASFPTLLFSVLAIVALATASRRASAPSRVAARSLVRALAAGLLVPLLTGIGLDRLARNTPSFSVQALAPVPLYVAALGAELSGGYYRIADQYPGARSVAPLAPLSPNWRRNVVLILGESTRKQTYGSDAEPSRGARRVSFDQMRALSSSTAISSMILWSGLPVTSSRDDAHSAPLVWDYAHAAGYKTGYYAAQTLLFGNNGHWLDGLPLDRELSATQIDPRIHPSIGADDAHVLDLALGDFGRALPEPFVAVVHLSNTHFPYKVDPREKTFPPDPVPFAEAAIRYERSVALTKERVRTFVERLRVSPLSASTVVVFVSDHGEQFYEHETFSHTHSLHEEEIRVPAWIDAPNALLADEMWSHLEEASKRKVTHADVLPTLLDLAGIPLEAAGSARSKMGRSLVRPLLGEPQWLLSNCAAFYACQYPSFAVLQGSHKLLAPEREKGGAMNRQCFDVDQDPGEVRPLPLEVCHDQAKAMDALMKGAHVATNRK